MKIDKLLFGLQVTIIGMGIVFFILYIISYIIDLTKAYLMIIKHIQRISFQ